MTQSENARKSDYCSGCVLEAAETILPPTVKQLDVLMVSTYPFLNGYATKKYVGGFGERSNQFAKKVLITELGDIAKLILGFTYALRCVTESVQFKPDAGTYNKCSYLLKEYIDKCTPKVIITLGVQAFKALEFKTAKLSDVRGRNFTFGKSVVIPTFHPMEIIKTPGKLELFKKDIALAASLVKGNADNAEVDAYTPIEEEEVLAQLEDAKNVIDEKAKTTSRPVVVAADTETTGLEPHVHTERMIAISISWDNNVGMAFLYKHAQKVYTQNYYDKIAEFFSNPNITLAFHNAKFDLRWLTNKYGIDTDRVYWDTMLAEHLVDEDKKGNYGLKDLTCLYYPSMGKYEDELKQLLADAQASAKAKYDSDMDTMYKAIVKDWCAEPSQSKAAEWVDKKYISLNEASELMDFKVSKRSGKITKATEARLCTLFKKVKEYVQPLHQVVTFEDIPLKPMLRYAAIDAIMTRKLVYMQTKACILDSQKTKSLGIKPLTWALHNIEIPLTKVLAEMEYNGVRLNRDKLGQYKDLLKDEIGKAERILYREVGREFNYKAKELLDVLYGELKLPIIKYTKTNVPCTDADTLSELYKQHQHPVLQALLTLRKYEKMHKTYLTAWEKRSEYDGRLHTSFNQTNTATHRLSSSNPEHRLGL